MDIDDRITGLAIFDISWVTWLMAGLAVGGVAMLLQRAIGLIIAGCSRTRSCGDDPKAVDGAPEAGSRNRPHREREGGAGDAF